MFFVFFFMPNEPSWCPEIVRLLIGLQKYSEVVQNPKYICTKSWQTFFSTRCKLRDDWVTGKPEFVGAAVENSFRSDKRFSGTSHALIHQRFCLLPGRRRRPGRTSSAWWWSEPRRSGASSRWTGPWRSGWAGSSTARAGCELGTAARPAAPGRCKSPTIPCSWAWRRPWWSAIAAGPCCPRRGCPEQRRKQNEPPQFPCKTERERKRDHRKCYLDWFFSTRRGKNTLVQYSRDCGKWLWSHGESCSICTGISVIEYLDIDFGTWQKVLPKTLEEKKKKSIVYVCVLVRE